MKKSEIISKACDQSGFDMIDVFGLEIDELLEAIIDITVQAVSKDGVQEDNED